MVTVWSDVVAQAHAMPMQTPQDVRTRAIESWRATLDECPGDAYGDLVVTSPIHWDICDDSESYPWFNHTPKLQRSRSSRPLVDPRPPDPHVSSKDGMAPKSAKKARARQSALKELVSTSIICTKKSQHFPLLFTVCLFVTIWQS